MAITLADELLNVLTRKADALVGRSASALAELLDPAFLYVTSRGDRFDKARYIDLYCVSGTVKFHSQGFKNIQIGDFGDFAAVAATVLDQFDIEGRIVPRNFQTFCIFRKTGAKWLWAGGQTMPLPAPKAG